MSYLDHVRRCNAHDLKDFCPFVVEGQAVGWVRRVLAVALSAYKPLFRVDGAIVVLTGPADVEERSHAFAALATDMVARGLLRRPRGESYPVVSRWGAEPVMHMDRGFATSFGILAFGVQITGYVETPSGLEIWIGRRAKDRGVEPGKLDSLVGGGLPSHLTLAENLVKEGAEEAGLTAAQAAAAIPVGVITYTMERLRGLKRDVVFCHDLRLSDAFVPQNSDGEVESFERLPVAEVMRLVRDTNEVKFNVNLVLIDFLVRHGLLPPETPDYVELLQGMRR